MYSHTEVADIVSHTHKSHEPEVNGARERARGVGVGLGGVRPTLNTSSACNRWSLNLEDFLC